MLDELFAQSLKLSDNAAVAWYLIASYLWFIHDFGVLSDDALTQTCKVLASGQQKHPHRNLIDDREVFAGRLLRMGADRYPMMVRASAAQLVQNAWGIKLEIM